MMFVTQNAVCNCEIKLSPSYLLTYLLTYIHTYLLRLSNSHLVLSARGVHLPKSTINLVYFLPISTKFKNFPHLRKMDRFPLLNLRFLT